MTMKIWPIFVICTGSSLGYFVPYRKPSASDWGQLQYALEGLGSRPNYAPSNVQDLHEDREEAKWLMEAEKLREDRGNNNNNKMFPLANEDSNFFWPDPADLFNLNSPRLEQQESKEILLPPPPPPRPTPVEPPEEIISMPELQKQVVDIQRDLMTRLNDIVTLEIKDAASHWMFSIYRPSQTDPNQVFLGRSASRFVSFPFDIYGDLLFVPSYFTPRVTFKLKCLTKARTFVDVCRCNLLQQACNFPSVETKAQNHANQTHHQIGGLQFNNKFLHLPSFKSSHLRFNISCMQKIFSMDDICRCQTHHSNPSCLRIDPALVSTTPKMIETTSEVIFSEELDRTTEEPSEESTEETTTVVPSDEESEEDTDESTEGPTESTEEPNESDESTDEPSEESTEGPSEESEDESPTESTEKPSEESTEEPSDETEERPETTTKPTKTTTTKPKTTTEPVVIPDPYMKHIKVYTKRNHLRIQLQADMLPKVKHSPQLKTTDPLESFHGKLITKTLAYHTATQWNFWVKKTKLHLNSSFPKISIISSIYPKTSLNDPKPKYELELPLAELDTLHSPRPSLAHFIADQLQSLKVNVEKIWMMLRSMKNHQPAHNGTKTSSEEDNSEESSVSPYDKRCKLCRKCDSIHDKKCNMTCLWMTGFMECQPCEKSRENCQPCDPWDEFCSLEKDKEKEEVHFALARNKVRSHPKKPKKKEEGEKHGKKNEDGKEGKSISSESKNDEDIITSQEKETEGSPENDDEDQEESSQSDSDYEESYENTSEENETKDDTETEADSGSVEESPSKEESETQTEANTETEVTEKEEADESTAEKEKGELKDAKEESDGSTEDDYFTTEESVHLPEEEKDQKDHKESKKKRHHHKHHSAEETSSEKEHQPDLSTEEKEEEKEEGSKSPDEETAAVAAVGVENAKEDDEYQAEEAGKVEESEVEDEKEDEKEVEEVEEKSHQSGKPDQVASDEGLIAEYVMGEEGDTSTEEDDGIVAEDISQPEASEEDARFLVRGRREDARDYAARPKRRPKVNPMKGHHRQPKSNLRLLNFLKE